MREYDTSAGLLGEHLAGIGPGIPVASVVLFNLLQETSLKSSWICVLLGNFSLVDVRRCKRRSLACTLISTLHPPEALPLFGMEYLHWSLIEFNILAYFFAVHEKYG